MTEIKKELQDAKIDYLQVLLKKYKNNVLMTQNQKIRADIATTEAMKDHYDSCADASLKNEENTINQIIESYAKV